MLLFSFVRFQLKIKISTRCVAFIKRIVFVCFVNFVCAWSFDSEWFFQLFITFQPIVKLHSYNGKTQKKTTQSKFKWYISSILCVIVSGIVVFFVLLRCWIRFFGRGKKENERETYWLKQWDNYYRRAKISLVAKFSTLCEISNCSNCFFSSILLVLIKSPWNEHIFYSFKREIKWKPSLFLVSLFFLQWRIYIQMYSSNSIARQSSLIARFITTIYQRIAALFCK